MTLKIAVLASGGGSNLQALIDRIADASLQAEIVCVISDNAAAFALQRARRAGIAAAVCVPWRRAGRAAFEAAVTQHLEQSGAELIVLAGFMRVLSAALVDRYRQCIINLHPSLLPHHRGLNTHQRAIDSGRRVHGASVHFVTAELDAGPVIDQRRVIIRPEDDAPSLARRVQAQEHQMLPQVVQWFAERRLHVHNNQVLLDHRPVPASA